MIDRNTIKRLFFKKGFSVSDIALKLGLSKEKGITTKIRNILGFKEWDEYFKTLKSIQTKIRYSSGFTDKLKREIKERDGGCIICGIKETLEIHHLDRNFRNNKPSNLVTLCKVHHNKLLGKKPSIEIIKAFIQKTWEFDYLTDMFIFWCDSCNMFHFITVNDLKKRINFKIAIKHI